MHDIKPCLMRKTRHRLDPHYKFKWQSRRKERIYLLHSMWSSIYWYYHNYMLNSLKAAEQEKKVTKKMYTDHHSLIHIFSIMRREPNKSFILFFFFFLSRNHHHQPAIHPRRLTWRHLCIFLSFSFSFF